MKRRSRQGGLKVLLAGLPALSIACGGGPIDDTFDVGDDAQMGQMEQSLMNCSNPDGANSIMAATAVAAAKELGRWQPLEDLAVVYDSSARTSVLGLTAAGKGRCADRVCANTQALLDMQKPVSSGQVKLPGGVVVNADALRSRLIAKYGEQQTCEAQPDNHTGDNCPAEEHKLTFVSSKAGACDTVTTFKATAPDGKPLKYPAQLKNKLLWVDRGNPYVAFQSKGEQVSIDPTYGLTEGSSTEAGSCTAACTKISTTSVDGACCTCEKKSKKFKRSAWNTNTYICT
jgi:hypothetical protein